MNNNSANSPLSHCRQHADALLAHRLVVLAAVFAVAGCVALSFDMLAGWVFLGEAGPIWSVLRRGLARLVAPAESFAHGTGVLLILAAMFAADAAHRRGLVRAVVFIFSAGLAVQAIKMSLARTRPNAFFAESERFSGGVLETFGGWLPLWKLGASGQSFPSGHTVAAVALAIVLCRRWPRAAWVFILTAFLAVMQRIVFGHHYPSDCLWAAAVACAVAAVFYHPRMLGSVFTRFENGTAAEIQSLKHEARHEVPAGTV